MSSDSLIQLLQKSVRVTIGATASLVELIQDPQQRNDRLTQLQGEFSQLAETWEVKGERTEQEARNFVDTILSQRQSQTTSTPPSAPPPPPSSSTPSTEVQQDLQEMTTQIAELRSQLERLREEES